MSLGRREFVVTTLTTGFALATRPVRAEAIKTDAAGLVEGQVDIGGMPAYRAVKEGKDKLPTVLVVQEIFGIHEYIKDVCRRLAKAGYFAVAPSLFARQGDVGARPAGATVFPALEGTRPVLVEIQALVVRLSSGATPRRAVVGWDSGRLAMVLAVLESRCGLSFSTCEVYLNIAGGYRISDPAADLAVRGRGPPRPAGAPADEPPAPLSRATAASTATTPTPATAHDRPLSAAAARGTSATAVRLAGFSIAMRCPEALPTHLPPISIPLG